MSVCVFVGWDLCLCFFNGSIVCGNIEKALHYKLLHTQRIN